MLLELPTELLEQILDCDCSIKDRWNLARTSRQHYIVFKPLVWKEIKLTKKHLVSSTIDPLMIKNFQYIQMLDIHVEHATPSECLRYGVNVSSLLAAIIPTKLSTLKLRGVCTDSFLLAINQFSCLQELDLKDVSKVSKYTWKALTLPRSLKKLIIASCPVSNKFINVVVTNCEKLEKLQLYFCGWLTGQCLIDISKAKNLKGLCIVKIGARDYKFDLAVLGRISKLRYLQLGDISIAEGSFRGLLDVTNTTSLTLINMKITEEEFSGIRRLRNLTHIFIYQCPLIKGSVFVETVCCLPALKAIDCDVGLFSERSHFQDLHVVLAPLNRMESLHTINIYHDEFEHPGICIRMVTALCWGEWKVWTVNVNNASSGQENILTLQKV